MSSRGVKAVWIAAVAIVALSGLSIWWIIRTPPPEPVVDVPALVERVEQLAIEVREAREAAERKVVIIREDVQTAVDALPPDGVAAGLDDELALWRRREVRPQRVDDP